MSRRSGRLLGGALAALALAAAVVGASAPVAASVSGDDSDPVRVFTIKDPRITESSGLATSTTLPGVVWTVNDSGDGPRVYGIDGRGRTVATLTLRGAPARDTEAVAVGPRTGGRSWLWVGDIGDNLSSWPTVRVYRAPEPTEVGDRDLPWTQFDLRFPGGPRDAETLLVDPSDGRLYVVSKRVQGAAVYAAPEHLREGKVNVLTRVAAATPLVTDGSFSSDGRLVLRDYLRAYVSDGIGEPSTPLAIPLQQQGESVTWTSDGSAVLVGSEGERSAVWRVPVPAAVVSPTVTPSPGPTSTAERPTPAGSAAASSSPSDARSVPVWAVLVGGLAVGAGLALLVRRVGRRRQAPPTAPR